jgi:hypothetical protein
MDIKQNVIDANILNLGFYTDSQYTPTFYQLTTVDGIDIQFERALNLYNNEKAPIRYLIYNPDEDCLYLQIVRFSYKDNSWIYDGIENIEYEAKWIRAIQNEYVLSYPSTSKVGIAYHNLLPVIFRI